MSYLNVLAVYQLANTADIAQGATWYHVANTIAGRLARKYDISERQAVGVIAALSPPQQMGA